MRRAKTRSRFDFVLIVGLAVTALLTGCSMAPAEDALPVAENANLAEAQPIDARYESAIQKAVEAEARNQVSSDETLDRAISSERSTSEAAKTELARGFERLKSRAGNQTFARVLVFPKHSNMVDRNSEPVETSYGRGQPIIFKLSLAIEPGTSMPLKGKCTWAQARKNTRFSSERYFGPYEFSAENADMVCAAVRVELEGKDEQAQLQSHRNSMMEVDLYIDSYYRGYGSDFVIGNGDAHPTNYAFPLSPRSRSISSGLTLFPIDLPSLGAVTMTARPGTLWKPDSEKVQMQLQQRAISWCDRAYTFQYKDHYGMKTHVGWCPGDAWPTVIENNRFYAVLLKEAN